MSRQARSSGIDLFRCLLIYGICAYHAFFCCGHASGSESRLWTWAVPGFAFVSGYFGVSFKVGKLVRLMLTGCVCAVFPWLLGGAYQEALFGYWYLYAYVLLMLLSPLINLGLDGMHRAGDYRPLWGVGLLAIWSWMTECFLTRQYVPHVAGMGALSFVSVFVAYVLGWCYREFPMCGRWLRGKTWLLIPLLPCLFALGHYTSPFTLAFVLLLFAAFEQLQMPRSVARFVSELASTGLSVYLLHANWPVLGRMKEAVEWGMAHGAPRYAVLCVAALGVFIVGAVLHLIVASICAHLRWRSGK